jgi:transcription-repair coupling factor (superfamily II helicase)
MKIQDLLKLYAQSPQVKALGDTLKKKSVKTIFLEGLMCSSAPVVFSAIMEKGASKGVSKGEPLTTLFVMQDGDDAGYFYHDLVQMLGEERVLFFPSSYRRAIKYGQRDAANEILRTEVLARLSNQNSQLSIVNCQLFIVSYPEALAELVVSKKQLSDKTLVLRKGEAISVDDVTDFLRELGFHEVDYVYEPGQFALRGSILDIYSFSSELPFRIDLFGDDIDSIRTFEVDTQLSKSMREQVEIVPELSVVEEKMPLLSFLPDDVLLVAKDFQYVQDVVERTYQEGFSQQALTERLESATEMEEKEVRMEMQREMQLVSGV